MLVRFHLLGTLQVTDDDGSSTVLGGFRQRMVLAVLLLHVAEPVPADRLIDAVWGDEPPPTARKTLQAYIARLRHVLGGDVLTRVPGGYLLQVDRADIDAARFERAAAEGRRLLQHDPEEAAAVLRAGLALWRGTPWGDLADQDVLRADVERLRERKLQALEDRLTADLALGRARSVTSELSSLVAEHPLRERLRGLLLTALYQDGRTADALAAFEDGRQLLVEELGAEPGPDLRELHRRIMQQDPTLTVGPAPTSDPPVHVPNPYKGLSPFGEHDAQDFFGRERLTGALLERVARSPVVVLVGPSGSGKSSAVLAGLLPALRGGALEGSDTWPIAVLRPGADPVGQLRGALAAATAEPPDPPPVRDDGLDLLRSIGRALPDDAARFVLVIDQFEELFLNVPDADRERFLRDLAEAVEDPNGRLAVVATLRADVLERPMSHPRLGPLIADGFVHALPLTPAELEAASVVPARQVGVRIEPELAAELVAEVAGRPGALPLFQYTLTELFEHRTAAMITVHDHRRLGGLSGVVARRAEATYDSLDEDAREACRQVFLRLVRLGDDGDLGRLRVVRDDLDVPLADLVLERFGAARLLAFDRDRVTDEPTVEVAHEAVFDAWPRLRAWIEEGRDQLRIQRSVAAAMREWESSDRDDADLLSGSRLDVASAWCRRPIVDPTSDEESYVRASLAARDREQAQEHLRRQRELTLERRASSRLRQLVAVLALATLVAGTLGGVAMSQRDRAERQRVEAQRATELVRARQLASEAIATRVVEPELSVLLALHATNLTAQADLEIPPDIVEALHWSLQSSRMPYPGDGDAVVVSGPQGPQGVFALPFEQLVSLARAEVPRDMTAEECADHFVASACPTLPEQLPALQAADPRAAAVPDDQPLAGTRVTLVHAFGDLEGESLRAAMDDFEGRTGISIETMSPSDELVFIRRGLEAQTPPDIALLPYLSAIAPLVEDGELIDVSTYLDVAELRTTMSPHLVSLGTVADDGGWPADEGGVYAIPVRAVNKSTIWYSLPAFEERGYGIPTSYDELAALTDRIVAEGGTPWCHGEESDSASGWPGTDLIENLLLHASIEDYDAWLRHDLGFTSTPLRTAFERMGDLLLQPGHVAGGHASAATLPFLSAPAPLFDDPPGCLMYPQGSFAASWFPFAAVVGRDVDVFPFPAITPDQEPVVLGAGDYAMTFTDRPEVREVMRFLISEDLGRGWARDDPAFMSPRSDFPLEHYVTCPDGPDEPCEPDPVRTSVAPPLRDALAADRFRFDGSDLLPHEVGFEPMWQAMVEYVGAGPDALDRILTDLERTWLERERAAAG